MGRSLSVDVSGWFAGDVDIGEPSIHAQIDFDPATRVWRLSVQVDEEPLEAAEFPTLSAAVDVVMKRIRGKHRKQAKERDA